jgi:hypothetical protein
MGSLAIGCSLVVAPYLMVSHSLAPAAAWSRLLGRHTIDSLEADARASFRPREVWNLPTGERMAFPVKESTTTSRFQGHAAAIAEYFKELPEAFHYWIGALAVVGLAARGIGLQPVGDSDRRHAGSPSHADRPTVGVQALACSPSPPAEAGIPTDRSWTTGLSKADGPFALFAAVYFIVHSAAVVYHAAGVGYLSPRHLLPLVLLGLGPAGRGAIALAQWLTVRVSPTRKRGEVPSDCIPASTSGPTAALAWAIVIASAAACLPRTLAPLHHSRMGHRQAGEWLAAASGPGPVLDTRGMTALYSGRMTYRYEAARRAFENPELAFVVVEERELGFESRRSRTLKHLLNGAAELVARFESPKRRAGEDVLLYRWRPERLAASLK